MEIGNVVNLHFTGSRNELEEMNGKKGLKKYIVILMMLSIWMFAISLGP